MSGQFTKDAARIVRSDDRVNLLDSPALACGFEGVIDQAVIQKLLNAGFDGVSTKSATVSFSSKPARGQRQSA